MVNDYLSFEKRKEEHIALALDDINEASELNSLDHLCLIHEALPDLDFADIDISSSRFKHTISKPFLVSSMTAGHKNAAQINYNLMQACAESNWTMGVGSQRRELSDIGAANEWRILRQNFPQ